jgi:hypothetical protein
MAAMQCIENVRAILVIVELAAYRPSRVVVHAVGVII